MVNWISSEDEKDVRKVDFERLCKIMRVVKSLNPTDEMTKYVCDVFDEYYSVLEKEPDLLRSSLKKYFDEDFQIDSDIKSSDAIISPSDLNSYYTIKELNRDKEPIIALCFDMHSDTYDYNDFLWKGNSFSRLMKEGYIDHYIVIGVPKEKRNNCLADTNEDLRERVHLIDQEDLIDTLNSIGNEKLFISIDADCFNCRESKYTSVEYSPSTILNYVSHLDGLTKENYVDKIHECVHVKNELGYSNYYHTGENNLTVDDVIAIINNVKDYYNSQGMELGINSGEPYFQLMEVSGYDYDNLTLNLVVKLIDGLCIKEVKSNEKGRVLEKSRRNV